VRETSNRSTANGSDCSPQRNAETLGVLETLRVGAPIFNISIHELELRNNPSQPIWSA